MPERDAARGGTAGRALLVGALALFALAPLALLALTSVSGGWRWPALLPERLTGEGWRQASGGGAALAGALGTSALLAVATGVLGTALALPVGRAMARLTGPARHLAAAAAFLPVAAPPVAVATGLQLLLLAAGVGGTLPGVLAAHLVPAVGYLALLFLATFALDDGRAEEAARTLGASRGQVLRLVTLPRLRRPIAEGVALGFLVSWGQVALTLIVGAGAVRTLPLEVHALVRAGQERDAAVGALLLVVPAAAAVGALRLAARRGGAPVA